MALLREALNVFLKGFAWLLPTASQVARVAGSHIRALGVVSEDFLEILPTTNHISR
jgi:hypothetical protein